MKPLVTVLIDTYNHERYIEQAIVSVLEQDFPASDMEILVVDDGSTDRTPEIVRKFASRVHLLRKKNGGQASAFNAGFPESNGHFISFLDGDDWFAPGKLTAVMTALEEHHELAAVAHGYYEFHDGTESTRTITTSEPKFLILNPPEAARHAFAAWNYFLTSSFTIKKEVLRQSMPIPPWLRFCADAPIALAAMAAGTRLLAQPLCYYRVHSENLYSLDDRNASHSAVRNRRKDLMIEKMLEALTMQAKKLRVAAEATAELLEWPWVLRSRRNLRGYGGNPLSTFRTEMRLFHMQYKNPSPLHRFYKHVLAAPAMLFLPPRVFYRLQDWSARPEIDRIRKALFRTNGTTG